MVKSDRDILEILKSELDFIEKGGYGRSVRTPWLEKSLFQDSLSCLNYADPQHSVPCSECRLLEFVNTEHQREEVPCHSIQLNAAHETIEELEHEENEAKLERQVKDWLHARIQEIEENRSRSNSASSTAVD